MVRFDGLTGLFRGRPRVEPEELQRYREAVVPLVEQLGGLYRRWREDLLLDAPEPDLANSASIQRWEAAGLRDRLVVIEPPAALARAHGDLAVLAGDTARAAQLLSNGYRFHSSTARCDGQALMLASEARFGTLSQTLARLGLSVEDGADGDAATGQ